MQRIELTGVDQRRAERVSAARRRLARTVNRALIPLEIVAGATRVWSRPHEVQFAAEHRCNLRCIMCASTASRNAGQPTLMDQRLEASAAEQFGKLVQLLPFLKQIALTGSGETLLCPDLEGILRQLKTNGVKAAFVTNGQLLNRARAVLLVEMQVEELVVSFDAGRKETYEKIRAGASWERLLDGLRILEDVKRERGSAKPKVTVAGNFMRMNIEELPGMVDVAAEHGAAGVWITETLFYDPRLRDQNLARCPELTRRMVTQAEQRARFHSIAWNNWLPDLTAPGAPVDDTTNRPSRPGESGWIHRLKALFRATQRGRVLSLRRCCTDPGWLTAALSKTLNRAVRRLRLRRPDGPPVTERLDILKVCRNPWTGLAAWRDGRLQVCCMKSVILGNIDIQSFEEIWNGPAARELRRSFLESRPPEGCRNCRLVEEGRRTGRLLPDSGDLARVSVPEKNLGPAAERRLCYFLEMPLEGDRWSGTAELSGWAWSPAGIREIRLLVDGQAAATALNGLHRPDVAARLGTEDAVASGFMARFSTGEIADGWHLIALRFTDGRGRTFDACHRTINIVKAAGQAPVAPKPTTSPTRASSSSSSGSGVRAAAREKACLPSGPASASTVSP